MKKICIALSALFALLVLAGIIAAVVSRAPGGDKVGLVRIEGAITSADETIQTIENYKKDPSVKAVVVRVDSPGGGVGPSQEIYEELKKTAAKKTVVVSMGSLAASGGYYISCIANEIYADPGTITGSIGVIMEVPNFKGLMDKIGIKAEVVKAGAHKDLASPFREMNSADRQILQGVLDNVHDQFIQAVADGRKMPADKVRAIADGRIFSGEQAVTEGLVDKIGDLQDAIQGARKLAHLKEDAPVEEKKKGRTLFDVFKSKVGIPDSAPFVHFSYLFTP